MAFALNPREPIGAEVCRVARSQMAKLNRDLAHPERRGIEESVHKVRKRAKKIRALARLVRPGLGDLYSDTNKAIRDTGRELAEARDVQVMPDTLDALMDALPGALGAADVSIARSTLFARKQRSCRTMGTHSDAFEAARVLAARGTELIDDWKVEDDFEVLAGGIARTHGRFVAAWQRCQSEPTVEAFHEWRKRAKYHRYHLRLLSEVYPSLMEPWTDEMHRLTDSLGDLHDLAVLTAKIRVRPGLVGTEESADAIIVLAEGRSSVLRGAALSLGARLAAEDTAVVVDRLRAWWGAVHAFGMEPDRVSLAGFA